MRSWLERDAAPLEGAERGARDARAAALGIAAWAGAWLGVGLPVSTGLAVLAVVALGAWRWRTSPWAHAAVVLLIAGWAAGMLRAEGTVSSQVAAWAQAGAAADVVVVITGDPRLVEGRFGPAVLTRAVVVEGLARGQSVTGRAPVLIRSDPEDPRFELGQRLRGQGRLTTGLDRDLAAVMTPTRPLTVIAQPDAWWRGAAAVRAGVREAVAGTPPGPRGLVPALVDGDDGRLPEQVEADFRTTGLTHLLAVSGTNLTLVSGFLVALARWGGVRGRGLQATAALGIVGFVLLARGEPSVLRAAAMGTVGLVALGAAGRDQGPRAWGVAVAGLVLLDPWLARSPGFALSALATAGILWWSPGWRDALLGWLPRWLAEATAVSAAAQLACTPVVAALSGEVSLVAVAANLLAGPVVGVATVAGLLGGLVTLVVPIVGSLLGWLGAAAAAWIIGVATWTARLPTPAVPWPTHAAGIAALTAACLLLAVLTPRLLRRPVAASAIVVLLTGWVAAPPGALRQLPVVGAMSAGQVAGWRIVQCDVGQGDAVVLRSGPAAALVVDVGREPAPVAECLDDLGVRVVPRLVLTHFHDDHVGGLQGVLESARVGEILVSGLLAPEAGVEQVQRLAAEHGVPVRIPAVDELGRAGRVTWQVLGTPSGVTARLPVEEPDGSEINDASVVMLADVAGPDGPPIRVLLTGDVEPDAQSALARLLPGLRVDVLKVPHHGSSHQDLEWLTGLGAQVALVGVGENDYGHPAPATLDALTRGGAVIGRTDLDGRLAVRRTVDGVELVTS